MADNELVLSMLSAASSLQKLNERLDRISLHSSPAQSPRTEQPSSRRERIRKGEWNMESAEASPLFDRGSLSGLDDSANESRENSVLRLSHTSSKFDSAFGSQTDEENGSLQSTRQDFIGRTFRHNYKQSPGSSSHLSTHSLSARSQSTQMESGQSQKRRKKRKHQHHTTQYISSPDTTPVFEHKHGGINRKSLASATNDSNESSEISPTSFFHSPALKHLKRGDSLRSLCSTASNVSTQSNSSRILSLELSTDDLRGMASMTHTRTKTRSKTLEGLGGHSPAVKLNAKLRQISAEVHEPGSDTETGNSGASTPVVSKKFQQDVGEVFLHRELEKAQEVAAHSTSEPMLTPEIIVVSPVKNEEKREHKTSKTMAQMERASPLKSQKRVTIVTDVISTAKTTAQAPPMGTVFYHESLTPQPSPRQQLQHGQLPRRYGVSPLGQSETDSAPRRRPNAPKRRTSILQRLRRRRGSFKKEKKHRERHITVKRSFSDRMTYDIRKGWIDYEEDLEFISNPSRLRRVGRMIARKAGTLHIVQLNRPPSGLYGIYISQTASRPGIFISRFADLNAAKFYSGLLSPGDEIIRVNKEDVKDKSVDFVYDMLEKLDSVIFSIIPVCSRPDW